MLLLAKKKQKEKDGKEKEKDFYTRKKRRSLLKY